MLNILFISSFLALAVGSIPLWLNAIARKRRTGALLESRETCGSPFGFLDIIVTFFFWFVGQIASIGVAGLLLGVEVSELLNVQGTTQAWLMFITAAGQLVATLMAMSVFLVRYKNLSIFGWQPNNLRQDVVIGGLAFVMVVPSILFVQWLLTQLIKYEQPTLEMLAKNADVLTISAAWFGAVFVAPICEEIFFRGVLQAWLQRLGKGRFLSDQVLSGGWDCVGQDVKMRESGGSGQVPGEPETFHAAQSGDRGESLDPTSDSNPIAPRQRAETALPTKTSSAASTISNSYWPILASAAVFGLAHFGQGPAPIPLFLFGLALGYLYRKTGSIIPCIVLHMLLNGFSMFWFTLQVLSKGGEQNSTGDMAQLVECFAHFVSKI